MSVEAKELEEAYAKLKRMLDVEEDISKPKFNIGDEVKYKNGTKKFIVVGIRYRESRIRKSGGYFTYEIKDPTVIKHSKFDDDDRYWMFEEKLEPFSAKKTDCL